MQQRQSLCDACTQYCLQSSEHCGISLSSSKSKLVKLHGGKNPYVKLTYMATTQQLTAQSNLRAILHSYNTRVFKAKNAFS